MDKGLPENFDFLADLIKGRTNPIESIILQAIYELGKKDVSTDEVHDLIMENEESINALIPRAVLTLRGIRSTAKQLKTQYKPPLVYFTLSKHSDYYDITNEGLKYVDQRGIFNLDLLD